MKKFILICLLLLLFGCNDNNKKIEDKKNVVEEKEVLDDKEEVNIEEEKNEEVEVKEEKKETNTKTEEVKKETSKKEEVIEKKEVISSENVNKYIDGLLIANKTYSLSSDYVPGNLVQCDNGKIVSDVCNKFKEMKTAASNDGVNIYLQSGYRSYATQEALYNGYVKRSGQVEADTYSARAGHSEHQTGLAFDICSTQSSSCINSGFDGSGPAVWLSNNAYKYGFILRYPSGKSDITGYKYESWHYRYVGIELATKLYNGGEWNTLEEYYGISSKYE